MSPSTDVASTAEQLKNEGNDFFKNCKYQSAIEKYSNAIDLDCNPTLLCNRAFAYIRAELPGAAISDANRAIELDRNFIKAYYRKATAHMMLDKFKEAFKDLDVLCEISPKDPDVKAKRDLCDKELRRIRFESAIISKDSLPTSKVIKLGEVSPTYEGPRLKDDTVTVEFADAMIAHLRQELLISRRDVVFLLLELLKMLQTLPNVVHIHVPDQEDITVCGDTHGQFYDLLNIFEINGKPSPKNRYLFNGDFVDRGSYSFENVMTLFTYKLLYPEHVFLSRGNHEGIPMNRMYGFEGEVKKKYSMDVFQLFSEVFDALPVAHVINDTIFVTHGGLYSKDNVTIADLQKPNRFCAIPDEGLLCESLWSDPQPFPGRQPSKRGVGLAFGPDITKNFLETNKLTYVVRSHEVKEEGYVEEHDGMCITVFSAPNYCDQMGNKGAFIRFTGGEMMPKFSTFSAVPHPGKTAMHYSNFLASMM